MPTVRTGPRGGKYIVSRGKKMYLSSMSSEKRKKVKRSPKKTKRRSKNKFGG